MSMFKITSAQLRALCGAVNLKDVRVHIGGIYVDVDEDGMVTLVTTNGNILVEVELAERANADLANWAVGADQRHTETGSYGMTFMPTQVPKGSKVFDIEVDLEKRLATGTDPMRPYLAALTMPDGRFPEWRRVSVWKGLVTPEERLLRAFLNSRQSTTDDGGETWKPSTVSWKPFAIPFDTSILDPVFRGKIIVYPGPDQTDTLAIYAESTSGLTLRISLMPFHP